jgi:hypothetical protein
VASYSSNARLESARGDGSPYRPEASGPIGDSRELGGDALDSVIAALATFKALRDPAFPAVESNDAYALEGYVYV